MSRLIVRRRDCGARCQMYYSGSASHGVIIIMPHTTLLDTGGFAKYFVKKVDNTRYSCPSGGSMRGRRGRSPPPPRRPPAQKTAMLAMFLLRTKHAIFVIFVLVKHPRSVNCLSSHTMPPHAASMLKFQDSRLYVATENDKTYANAQLKSFNACC